MGRMIGEVIVYLLAIQGLMAVISQIVSAIRLRRRNIDNKTRLLLVVKNCEDTIEGTIRSAYMDDLPIRMQVGPRLTVLDLGSVDMTLDILYRLKREYPDLEIIEEEDKDRIFSSFRTTHGIHSDLG